MYSKRSVGYFHQVQSEAMDSTFKACTVCTNTCLKEHGDDATKTSNGQFTRPPCFLVTSVDAESNWLPIPKEFVDAHGNSIRGNVRLEGAYGRVWSVEVGGPTKYVGFKGGWKNFVASNSLKRGDQVLFTLVSKQCFVVNVFNKLGVDVTPAHSPAPEPIAAVNGKRKRQVKEELSENSDSGSSENSEHEASKSEAESSSASEASEDDGGNTDDEVKPLTGSRGVRRKVTPLRSKTSHKKKLAGSMIKEFIEPGSMTTTYESLRRKVTDAERAKALKAAQAYLTTNPHCHVVMMPSHVYRGFWLTIPGHFSKRHLPRERCPIKVQDVHGFDWPASWIKSEHHTGISGGWAAFSKDHRLEEGDVCVFEVVDFKDFTILVTIFRVVDVKIVPGTRGGWEKNYNIVYGKYRNNKSMKGMTKKTSAHTVKRNLAKAIAAEARKGKRNKKPLTSESDVEDDELPVKKLYNGKGSQGSLDELLGDIDVKPTVKVKQEPGFIKVKQEPGVSAASATKAKQENGIYSDVKPSVEQLKSILKQHSSPPGDSSAKHRFAAAAVKPEPVEGEGRTWYRVTRLLDKRQNKDTKSKELLVSLAGPVVRANDSSLAVQNGDGNWWVPFSQFSPDCSSCYVD